MDSSDGCNTPPAGTAPHPPSAGGSRLLGALLVLILGCLFASTACRGHEERVGAGGQSGDEGRRAREPWLGTGGVAAVPARP
jgi:hypothetical protein